LCMCVWRDSNVPQHESNSPFAQALFDSFHDILQPSLTNRRMRDMGSGKRAGDLVIANPTITHQAPALGNMARRDVRTVRAHRTSRPAQHQQRMRTMAERQVCFFTIEPIGDVEYGYEPDRQVKLDYMLEFCGHLLTPSERSRAEEENALLGLSADGVVATRGGKGKETSKSAAWNMLVAMHNALTTDFINHAATGGEEGATSSAVAEAAPAASTDASPSNDNAGSKRKNASYGRADKQRKR
jgi:hypothetical protein